MGKTLLSLEEERFKYMMLLVKLSFLDRDSIRTSNDYSCGQTTEKSVVYNSNGALNFLCHLWCILDGFLEVKVYNIVSIVCDSDFITIILVILTRSHT